MTRLKGIWLVLLSIAILIMLGTLIYMNWHSIVGFLTGSWQAGHAVVDPASGQYVLVDELTILASGEDIVGIVAEYDGEVVLYVPETDTYQVRFPVKDLKELEQIRVALESHGITAYYSIVLKP